MEKTQVTKKTTSIKDRKKAQPKAVMFFSEAEKATIKQTVADKLSDSQFSIFMYTCQALGLNPLLNEITAISYAGNMSIQVMRDGFLTVAHRSGKFAGLESGVKMKGDVGENGKEVLSTIGWARVYHKDFTVPVYQEADLEEYSTGKNLWATKPKTMIKKVAESMALRKAFNVSGVYAPEEMDREIERKEEPKAVAPLDPEKAKQPADPNQLATLNSLNVVYEDTITFGEAADLIKKFYMDKKK
jgi:phage recombination protein Bet